MQSSIILSLNAWMASSPTLTMILPILADIFVFSYPIYLIYLYFFTHDHTNRWERLRYKSDNRQHKYEALSIFISFITAILINYTIKFFVSEPRPYHVLNLTINPKESLLLNTIPVDSFPSDHAAVGLTIAVSTLILGYRHNNKNTITLGRLFVIFALIMDVCRVSMGIHRPGDILGGSIVGVMASLIITYKPIQQFLKNSIYNRIITLQESLFGYIKNK